MAAGAAWHRQALALGLANLLIARGKFDAGFATRWSNGPLLVRADTGRFLRQCDIDPSGSQDVLYAQASGAGDLVAYNARSGRWLERDAKVSAAIPAGCAHHCGQYHLSERFRHLCRRRGSVPRRSRSGHYWSGREGPCPCCRDPGRGVLCRLLFLERRWPKSDGHADGPRPFSALYAHRQLRSPRRQRARRCGELRRHLRPGSPRSGAEEEGPRPWPSGLWARACWVVTARDTYRAILSGEPYPVRMLLSFGTNLIASQPDTRLAERAFEALEFHVHADFFVNATAATPTSYCRPPRRGSGRVCGPALTSVSRAATSAAAAAGDCASRWRAAIPTLFWDSRPARSRRSPLRLQCGSRSRRDTRAIRALRGRLRQSPEGVELPTRCRPRRIPRCHRTVRSRGFPTPTRRVEVYSERLLEHGYAPVPALGIGHTCRPERISVAPGAPPRPSLSATASTATSPPCAASSRSHTGDGAAAAASRDIGRAIGCACERLRARGGAREAGAGLSRGYGFRSARLVDRWPNGSPYDAGHKLGANINQVIEHGRAPIRSADPFRCGARGARSKRSELQQSSAIPPPFRGRYGDRALRPSQMRCAA